MGISEPNLFPSPWLLLLATRFTALYKITAALSLLSLCGCCSDFGGSSRMASLHDSNVRSRRLFWNVGPLIPVTYRRHGLMLSQPYCQVDIQKHSSMITTLYGHSTTHNQVEKKSHFLPTTTALSIFNWNCVFEKLHICHIWFH